MGKTQQVWFAVEADGSLAMFTKEPERDKASGRWRSRFRYVNSIIMRDLEAIVKRSGMDFSCDPQCLEFEMIRDTTQA